MRCKKILVGFGGSWFQTQEIDFIRDYVAQANALVVGAILTGLAGVKEHKPCGKESCKASPACIQKKSQRDRERLTTYLQQIAEESGFQAVVRAENGISLPTFLQESRFADLLVITQETWRAYTQQPEVVPVSQLLTQCECPVLVVPTQAGAFEQVVLTYDGSPQAMQGIKQFLYLMPELAKDLPVTILATYSGQHQPSAQEERLFVEYLKQHFSAVALHKLSINTENTLVRAVGLNERSLVIINNHSPQELTVLNSILHPPASRLAPLELFTRSLA